MGNRLRGFTVVNHPGLAVAPEPSASVDLADTDRGFLPNRLTTVQRDAIPDPAPGLLIFNTSASTYQFFDGAAWQAIGGGSSGLVLIARKPLSSAQLLALNTSPVEIIPTPGPDKVIVVLASVYRLFFGTTPYTIDTGDQGLIYLNLDFLEQADAGNSIFTRASDSVCISSGIQQPDVPSGFVNLPIALYSANSNLTGGDGSGEVVVYYVVADVSSGS